MFVSFTCHLLVVLSAGFLLAYMPLPCRRFASLAFGLLSAGLFLAFRQFLGRLLLAFPTGRFLVCLQGCRLPSSSVGLLPAGVLLAFRPFSGGLLLTFRQFAGVLLFA